MRTEPSTSAPRARNASGSRPTVGPSTVTRAAGPGQCQQILDGELCGVLPDGRTAFNLVQNAADTRSGSLVFFLFDLLFLDDEDLRELPLIERKDRLKTLLADAPSCLQFTDHQIGRGPAFHRLACEHGLEGIVSKRVNGPYEPGRRTWLKTKVPHWRRTRQPLGQRPVFEGSRTGRANCRSRRS